MDTWAFVPFSACPWPVCRGVRAAAIFRQHWHAAIVWCPPFSGRKHGPVHALRLHCASVFIACACMAAFPEQWFGAALHSHHGVSLGISTLMSFKSVWYLHSCSFGLHSLHAGPCPPSHHRTHFACSRAWARGGGRLAVWCFACAALPGSRLACMFVLQELFRRGWPRCLGSGFQCFASDLCQFFFVGCAPSRA